MTKETNRKPTRHELRIQAMQALYRHLLMGKDIRACVFEVSGQNQIDPLLYNLTIDTVKHEEEYRQTLAGMLRKDWDFSRLSLLEQAILLMSMEELCQMDTPKSIVIDEAVTLAKEYCDDESFKLVNGVLDRL